MKKIEDGINTTFPGLPYPEKLVRLNTLQKYVVAHEMGHLLYLEHVSEPVLSIMRPAFSLQDFYTKPGYLEFTVKELLALQAIEKPR